MAYVEPVPGGTIGRTDQGVDISAPPGTRVRAITRERLVGIIRNWYNGQPFYWFQQLNSRGRPTGQYNYVAEQFRSRLRIGQTVQAGQTIGTVAPTGTGLELGFATRSGQTLAAAQRGYGGSQSSPAGRLYRMNVINQGSLKGTPGPNSYLANLWIDAGGSPKLANLMAAIAMAESSGNPTAVNHNTNGSTDYGLWQINSSHTQYNANKLLSDPLYNAKAAVAIEKSQGLGAWTTYSSGAYKQFMNGGTAAPKYGGSRPGGANNSGPSPDTQLKDYVNLRDSPRTAPPGTKNPAKWWWASFTGNWDQLYQDASS